MDKKKIVTIVLVAVAVISVVNFRKSSSVYGICYV